MGWQAKGSCKSLFAKAYRAAQARLAQSAERKALNLVVVGLSPTVGVLFAAARSFINIVK